MSKHEYCDNPQHWRSCAEQARVEADLMVAAETRSAMLQIAEQYEMIACHTEARIAQDNKLRGSM